MAILLSAAYLSFISRGREVHWPTQKQTPEETQHEWLESLTEYVANLVERRLPALHAAIVSLGFGVLFLPTVYLNWADRDVYIAAVVALVITSVSALASWVAYRKPELPSVGEYVHGLDAIITSKPGREP